MAPSSARARLVCVLGVSLAGCPGTPAPPQAPRETADPADPALPDLERWQPVRRRPEPPRPREPAGLGALRQPEPVLPREGAVYEVAEFPPRPPELRVGTEDDSNLVGVYCVGCHSPAYIAGQPPLTRAGWEAEVNKMRTAYGAAIPDPVATRIATYLHAYYGLDGVRAVRRGDAAKAKAAKAAAADAGVPEPPADAGAAKPPADAGTAKPAADAR